MPPIDNNQNTGLPDMLPQGTPSLLDYFRGAINKVSGLPANPAQNLVSGIVGRIAGVRTPSSPTIGQSWSNYGQNYPLIKGFNDAKQAYTQRTGDTSDIKFKMSPEYRNYMISSTSSMALGATAAPETAPNIGELPTGTKLTRDMRTTVNPDFRVASPDVRVGTSPTETVMGAGREKFPSDITEEPLPKPSVKEPAANVERTFSPKEGLSKDEILTNQKRNIKIDGRDVRSPNDVNQINSTLNGYKINGTSTEQLQQTIDLRKNLGDQAIKTIATEGGTTSSKDALDLVTQRLRNTKVQSGLNDIELRGTANNYMVDLYERASGNATGSLPPNIPDPTFFKMKQLMNEDASSTFAQTDPTKWTPGQTVARYSRDVFDHIIDANHPTVAKLNNDMSDLYKAEDSLRAGANAEGTVAQKSAQNPPNLLQRIEQHPGIAIPTAILGAGTIGAFGKDILKSGAGLVSAAASGLSNLPNQIMDKLGYERKGIQTQQEQTSPVDQFHIPNIPQDAQTGHYQLPQDTTTEKLVPGTPEYTQAQNAISSGGRQFMQNAPQYINSANTVMDSVKGGMPLDILHSFKSAQDWQAYLSNPNNPYAKQLASVSQFNQSFRSAYNAINGVNPDDSQLLSPGDSASQFIQKYQQMVSFIHNNYSQFQTPYFQTTETPTTPNLNTRGGTVGGGVQYSGLPTTPPPLPANMLQGPIDNPLGLPPSQ